LISAALSLPALLLPDSPSTELHDAITAMETLTAKAAEMKMILFMIGFLCGQDSRSKKGCQ